MGKFRTTKLAARSETLITRVLSGEVKLTDEQWASLLDDYAFHIRQRLEKADIPTLGRSIHDGPWHRRTE